MNRLFEFFYSDASLRIVAYKSAGTAALVYVLVNSWFLHRPDDRIFSGVVWVIAGTVALFIAWGFARREPSLKAVNDEIGEGGPKYKLQFYLIGIVAAVFLLTMPVIDVNMYQAYLANAALEKLSIKFDTVQGATLKPEQVLANARRIQSIVSTSAANQIPLSPNVLNKTEKALSRYLKSADLPQQSKQAGYEAAVDLQSLAYTRGVQVGSIQPQLANQAYVLNSVVRIKDQNAYFQGNNTPIAFGVGGGGFYVENGSIVFDKIDFRGMLDFPPGLEVGPGGSIVVIESTMEGGMQPLEGITWINVEFRNMKIGYYGGPLRLRNVTFTNCIADRPRGPIAERMASQIIQMNGQRNINYFFDPPAR